MVNFLKGKLKKGCEWIFNDRVNWGIVIYLVKLKKILYDKIIKLILVLIFF